MRNKGVHIVGFMYRGTNLVFVVIKTTAHTNCFYIFSFRSLGFRLGLQSVTGVLTSLFFLGLCYRSASLYHPQRRAILHLKDMSKRKGKDKNKMENKPPYFDLTTLKAKPFHVVLLSTALTAFGVYTPLFFFVSKSYNYNI